MSLIIVSFNIMWNTVICNSHTFCHSSDNGSICQDDATCYVSGIDNVSYHSSCINSPCLDDHTCHVSSVGHYKEHS